MGTLEITETITIDCPYELVRAQFGDVAHHQDAAVHDGVRFEVIDDDGHRCRYRQITQVGPIELKQHITLVRRSDALVNTVTEGQLAGGTITFHIRPEGSTRSQVTAVVEAELRGFRALAGPLLRAQIPKQLRSALIEDKDDLEQGHYRPRPTDRARPLGATRTSATAGCAGPEGAMERRNR